MADEFVVPDSIEPVVGYRAWSLHRATMTLCSLTNDAPWPKLRKMIAVCHGVKHCAKADVPTVGCTCGLYAALDFNHLFDQSYSMFDIDRNMVISGEVNVWGGCINGTRGLRAQFSYPKKLLIPYTYHKIARPLAEAYGVPYELFNTMRRH